MHVRSGRPHQFDPGMLLREEPGQAADRDKAQSEPADYRAAEVNTPRNCLDPDIDLGAELEARERKLARARV